MKEFDGFLLIKNLEKCLENYFDEILNCISILEKYIIFRERYTKYSEINLCLFQ